MYRWVCRKCKNQFWTDNRCIGDIYCPYCRNWVGRKIPR